MKLKENNLSENLQPRRAAYRIKEFAQMCGVSEKSIRRAIVRGHIRVNRLFRVILIPASEIERFVNNVNITTNTI